MKGHRPIRNPLHELANLRILRGHQFRRRAMPQHPCITDHIDIVGNAHSSVYDSLITYVKGTMVKVFSWYDNEWGYSSRVTDLVDYMVKL